MIFQKKRTLRADDDDKRRRADEGLDKPDGWACQKDTTAPLGWRGEVCPLGTGEA